MGNDYLEKREEQVLDLHGWLERAEVALEQQWMELCICSPTEGPT